MRYAEVTQQAHRMVTALKRLDENGVVYDLTRTFIEEARFHPVAPHDDMLDATSRVYDMEPRAPTPFEAVATEMPVHPDS